MFWLVHLFSHKEELELEELTKENLFCNKLDSLSNQQSRDKIS